MWSLRSARSARTGLIGWTMTATKSWCDAQKKSQTATLQNHTRNLMLENDAQDTLTRVRSPYSSDTRIPGPICESVDAVRTTMTGARGLFVCHAP